MRRYLFTILIIFFNLVAVYGQQPSLTFDNQVLDLGNISYKQGKVTAVFNFTNTSGETVLITKARASCGCTTVSHTMCPVAKGKKGEVTVIYDPKGRSLGFFEKSVLVYTNLSDTPIKLKIRGIMKK